MTNRTAGRVHAGLPNQRQPRVDPDAFVLAGRPLLPGVRLSDTSRFSEDIWRLKHAQMQRHQTDLVMNFTRVPARFRQVAKEVSYTLLASDLPPGCEQVRTLSTIRRYAADLRRVLVWVDDHQALAVSALTGADVEEFARHLAGLRESQDAKNGCHRALRLLWLCRTKISDPLTFDPAAVLAGLQPSGSRSVTRRARENATSRIPEQVLAPYLVWALRWINDFADDVIGAHDEWRQLNRWSMPSRRRRGQQPIGFGQAGKQVAKVLNRYRLEGRPLPGWKGSVNRQHLAREAQVERTSLVDRAPGGKLIREAAAELGIADAAYLRVPVRGLLDGKPWHGPIEYADVEPLTRMLQTACYIVIAFLSGMRDSEVKHIKRGGVSAWRDEDGHVVRRRLTSLAFKGEAEQAGVEATWVISASAQRAVEVLQRLQPDGQDALFALLPPSHGYIAQGGRNEARTTSATNADLTAFTKWINGYCQKTGSDDTISLVNGQDWKVTTSQFRRTLAWFIARRPGGVIAGALQFRHLCVQMFEGYAGTSESGFRDEVEAEDAIARGEKLGDLIVSHEFHRLSGPAAAEAESRLAEFERHVQFCGKVFNDAKRLQRHMNRHDPHIYPGDFVTCVHNPDRALCRRSDGRDGPSLPDCQPLRCRNVALSSDNILRMREALAAYDRELELGDHLAPLVRHRLGVRRQEIAGFLTAAAANDPAPETS
ncbi:hypothetical protein [Streptomyces sp. NBC_01264]|uniref:hypothetical protein n=1 Tax=Streptomyces sp. NBC_01264 TaxID=2903804 RepID=UPI00224DA6C3|nr:hypothetical protein [Streptomyces sp. NBC_01264]MCX4776821.1 hypothetical protein [Streptomyces sp. NBC_01264]